MTREARKTRNVQDTGRMDRRIRVDWKSVTRGLAGGKVEGWSVGKVYWARKDENSNRKIFSGSAMVTNYGVTFYTAYNADLNGKPANTLSVVEGKRRYNVLNVRNTEDASFEHEIICNGQDWEEAGAVE